MTQRVSDGRLAALMLDYCDDEKRRLALDLQYARQQLRERDAELVMARLEIARLNVRPVIERESGGASIVPDPMKVRLD